MRGKYLCIIVGLTVFLALIPFVAATSNSVGDIEILSISATNFTGNLGTDFIGTFQVRNNNVNQSMLVSFSESGFSGLDVNFNPASRSIGPGQTDTINFEIVTEPDSGTGIYTGQIYAQYDSSNRDYFDAIVNLTPSSSGDKLRIDSVYIENDPLIENGTVEGLFPLDRVDIEVNVKSLFTENTNPRIDDIQVEIEIQNIADRGTDDINMEAVEFYLDPKESKELKEFEFIVPKDVENNKLYAIVITAKGKDQEGVRHTAEFRGFIRTERAADDIRLTRFEIYPENITCEDKLIFTIEVTNLGIGKEDEAAYTIKSSDLDLFFRETFELDADPGRRTSEFNNEHTFELSPNIKPGRYQIIVKTYSDSTKEQDVENYYFNIYECKDRQPVENNSKDEKEDIKDIEDKKEEIKDLEEKKDIETSTDNASGTVEPGEVESYDVKSPLENKKLAILLIIGIAIVALILLYIAYMLIF